MSTLLFKLRKEKGEMIYVVDAYKKLHLNYLDALAEGQEIEIFISPVLSGKATAAQIAKVHKCIRDIHTHTGEDFETVKLLVKEKAGLLVVNQAGYEEKSFADCTKEEINSAIQAAVNIGETVGINLY
jgi:hypothetical protein